MKFAQYLCLSIIFLLGNIGEVQAQCTFDNVFYTSVTLTGNTTSTAVCAFGGEYVSVSVTSGETYVFTTCGSTAGGDSQITLFNSTNTAVSIGYNDDDCGLLSTVTWVATFTGTVFVQVSEYNCTSSTICYDLDLTCITCGGATAGGCSYQLDLFDSFGDGWNGSSVDVYIDGVLDGSYTITGASGSATFSADSCEVITLNFVDGGGLFNNEVSYNLYELPDLVIPIFSADYFLTTLLGDVFNTTCGNSCGGAIANNVTCDSMAPICTTTGVSFTAQISGVDANVAYPGPDYGCLGTALFGSAPDPTFWYLEVSQTGAINMSLSAPADIDYIIWGPFSSLSVAASHCTNFGIAPTATNGAIIDCSYNATNNETPTIASAIVGEVYVMMITNFANTTQPISLTQTGGIGATNCNIVCTADAGTVSVDMPNTGANNYVLCSGDAITIGSNQDYVLPTPADIAGLGFGIYNCSPTTGNPDTDPCFTGYYWTGDTISDLNTPGGSLYDFVLNNPIVGFSTASGNSLCFVPITMDDIASIAAGGIDDNIGHDVDLDSCFVEGPPICVTYLDPITATITDNCQAVVFVLEGGYPGFNPGSGSYTVANTGAGTMTQTGVTGDTITFTGYTLGQTVSFDVSNDGNGCFNSFTHTSNLPPVVTLDNIVNSSCSANDGAISITTVLTPCIFTIDMFDAFGDGWNGAAVTVTIDGTPATGSPFTFAAGFSATALFTALPGQAVIFTYVGGAFDNEVTYDIYQDGNLVFSDGLSPTIGLAFSTNCPLYIYNWSNAAATEDITTLAAGPYTLTVTDNNSCTSTSGPHSVLQANAPVVTLSSIDSASCNGSNDGAVNVSLSGGTPTITYLWSDGQITQNATGLMAGNYTITVTDGSGCSATSGPYAVLEPATIVVTIDSVINGNCAGDFGAIYTTASGGTAGYTYLWSNTALTDDIIALVANTYAITVTDANTCTATSSAAVSIPPLLTSVVTVDSNETCFGGANGGVSVVASGGTPYMINQPNGTGYTYLWTNGSVNTTSIGLSAGSHCVTITDSLGCLEVVCMTVTSPTAVAASLVSSSNLTCNGDASGSITVSGSGGTVLGTYTYLWNVAAGSQATATATGLSANVGYTVTVTDDNGCSDIISNISLTEPLAITVTIDNTVGTACGDSSGLVMQTSLGGTGALTYNWSNGAITEDVSGLLASSYTVTVTDASGCSTTNTAIVNNTAAGTISFTTTDATCNGASDGCIVATVTGNTGGLSYAWSNGAVVDTICGLAAGTYTLTVTDTVSSGSGSGVQVCIMINDTTIGQPTAVVVTVDSSINVACNPTGAVYISATGGTGTLSYSWSNGAITEDILGLVANIYTVTVSDVNSCSMTASVTITQASGTSVTASVSSNYNGEDVSCFGSTDGEVTAVGSGGSPTYSFVWDNGQSTAVATGLGIGTYNVTVTDAGGCSATDVVSVTEPNTLAMSVDTIAYAVCTGSSNGFINISVSGGTGAIGYNWSNGDITQDISGLIDSTYTVLVTDANGCTTADTMVVGTLGFIEIVVDSITTVGCNGDSTGAIFATATGDTSLFNCSSSLVAINEIMYRPGSQDGFSSNPLITGEYLELIGPAGANIGCYVLTDGDWSITVPAGTTIPPDGFFTLGHNASPYALANSITYDLDVANCGCFLSAGGGNGIMIFSNTGEYVALYDGSGTFVEGVIYGTPTFGNTPPNGASTFGAVINTVGLAGCVASVAIPAPASFQTAPSVLTANISLIRLPDGSGAWGPQVGGSVGSCNSFGTVSTGNGTVTYLWSNGGTTQDVSGLPAGNYTVTATNSYGCTATTSYTLTEPALLTTAITNTVDIGCVGDSTGSIDIAVAGGTSPYGYNWSNGATTQNIASLAFGTYCVTVTDSNSCVATVCDSISEPFFNIPTDTFFICPGDSVQIQLNTNATLISWTPSATLSNDTIANPFASPIITTTYVVNASVSGFSCVMMDSVVVIIQTLDVSFAGQTNPVCNGDTTGTITTSIGAGIYNYIWSNGATTANLSGLGQGTYMLTVSNSGTCIDTLMVTIAEPAALTVTLSGSSDVICPGDSTGLIAVTAGGGTPTYSYLWTSGETTAAANALWAGFTVVTVTDANACTATFDMNVVEPAIIQVSSLVIPAGCGGASDGSIAITPIGGNGTPYTYLWNAGASSQTTATATGLGLSTYTVTVTDNAGCISTANGILVPQAAALDSADVALNVADTTLACDLAPVVIGINTINNYTYLWSNGETNQNAINLGLGVYFVTVTNSDGCFIVQTGTISAPEVPSINPWIENIGQTSVTTTSGTLINLDGGNLQTGVNYLWMEPTAVAVFDGETDHTTMVSANQSGTYVLTLTATSIASGCQDTGTVVLNVEGEFVGMPNAFSPNGDGRNEIFYPLGLSANEIIRFRVFNRWGQEVYNGDELENGGWDGKYLGVPQASEAYLFLLEYDLGVKVKLLKGEFILIR